MGRGRRHHQGIPHDREDERGGETCTCVPFSRNHSAIVVPEKSSLRDSGGDDDRVLHGIVLEHLDRLSDSGAQMANGNINAL